MNRTFLMAAATVLVAAILPYLGRGYLSFVLCSGAIYFIVALSLNVLVGMAGQISIGHAAFWAIGAYGSALAVVKLGMPFAAGVAVGGGLAGLVGMAVAFPALRIQGHYLAIATLAFALFVEQVLHEWDAVTGGRAGMFVPRPNLFGFEIANDRELFLVLLFICCLLAWMVWNLQHSQSGRALRALHMSPTAAQCCGINRRSAMIKVFTISACLCGISGALYAHFIGYLSASTFSLGTSLSFLTMVVIGGTTSIAGALMGAIFLAVAPEVLRELGDLQLVIYGVLLLLCVIFFPSGLAGVSVTVGRRLKALQRSEQV